MPRSRKLVMVTNDDSVQSDGLLSLAKEVSRHAEVIIVAPEQPQSATAMSLTFHKPLRATKVRRGPFQCYAVSGTPGDCVMIGVNKLLPRRPDLVVSGINIGDNDTFQDVLASGTVAAALQSAIAGIPAIAFSMEVGDESLFALEYDQPDFSVASFIAGEIAGDVLEHGMPGGADVLNVNFPPGVRTSTEIRLTEVGRHKYTDKVLVRKDPRGRAYYWLFCERLSEFPSNSDARAVLTDRKVSISPMVLNMSGPVSDSLEHLRERVERKVKASGTRGRLRNK
ncbi:MAG: 5'/3'-nucleotidase SurE [Thaumarchaeota archaeon]|nr:5'/3'-nucleotidase SurE [Nitrososphaerota archaeon]